MFVPDVGEWFVGLPPPLPVTVHTVLGRLKPQVVKRTERGRTLQGKSTKHESWS